MTTQLLPVLLCVRLALGQPTPADSPQRLLTLNDAIEQALAANPAITASNETRVAADARMHYAWTGFLPQLLVSMSYRRATANMPLAPYIDASALPPGIGAFLSRDEPTSYNNYAAGVTLNHTIWDFGRTLGGWQAARELVIAAGADQATSRDQVRLNTTLAYYMVLATHEAVSVAEETVHQREQHLALARGQADAGVRQRIDVTRAEADLASAKLNLSKAKNGLLITRVNLATILGQDAAPDFRVELPPPGVDPDTTDLEDLVRTALDQRPDVRGLSARLRASGHLVEVARAGFYPRLGLSAGVNRQGYELDADATPYNWFVGLTLEWNAFALVSASAASREALANAGVLEANLRSLKLGIRAEVESAALALREARERIEPATALVTSAAETLRLAEGRYSTGAGSSIELTDAQAAYTQARLSKIQAEYDIETARASLQRALGAFAEPVETVGLEDQRWDPIETVGVMRRPSTAQASAALLARPLGD